MEPVHASTMTVDAPDSSTTTKSGPASTAFVDLSETELDALLERIEQAKTHGLALSVDDYELLMGAVMMLTNMQERLEKNDLSVLKLRKLLGMVRSSEKLRDLLPTDKDKPSSQTKEGKPPCQEKQGGKEAGKKGRKNKSPNKPQLHHHALEGISTGDRCQACNAGKLYKYTPAVLLRVSGNAPLSCHRHLFAVRNGRSLWC